MREVTSYESICTCQGGRDEEIKIKDLSIKKHLLGSCVSITEINGEHDVVLTDDIVEQNYRPDKLRTLHYQIMCLNHDMIELKKKVTQALVMDEESLLTEFLRQNPKLRRILPRDGD